jgi:protein-L-isoaspartate(D-aspartate) O-methyltransferase
MQTREQLIDRLKNDTKVLQTLGVEEAFRAIDRADFVSDDYIVEAYEDYPIPIGHGQTISQPTTVAFMLEKLDPQPSDNVLDVGCGSGWTTALVAHMVGEQGHVYGVELLPELVLFGQHNLKKYSFPHASIVQAGEKLGLADQGPFDRILVSAAAEELPDTLVDQLKEGGTMVIPVQDTIVRVQKGTNGKIKREEFPGFVFVPLIH